MTENMPESYINLTIEKLTEADRSYYNSGHTTMPDEAYDILMKNPSSSSSSSQEKSGLGTALVRLKAHKRNEELRKLADIMFRYLPSVLAM